MRIEISPELRGFFEPRPGDQDGWKELFTPLLQLEGQDVGLTALVSVLIDIRKKFKGILATPFTDLLYWEQVLKWDVGDTPGIILSLDSIVRKTVLPNIAESEYLEILTQLYEYEVVEDYQFSDNFAQNLDALQQKLEALSARHPGVFTSGC